MDASTVRGEPQAIRVLLMPDVTGEADDSDWELIDEDAGVLGRRLARWAEQVRDQVRTTRPALPEGIRGRARERWLPLARVAAAAGGTWPQVVDDMARQDKEQQEMDAEDGLVQQRPHVALLKHLHELWPEGETFVPTGELLDSLAAEHPDMWGGGSPFGKPLTAQRLGRMLANGYGVNSTRLDRTGPRGYTRVSLGAAWRRMGVAGPTGHYEIRHTPQGYPSTEGDAPVPEPLSETGPSGATGATGAQTPATAVFTPPSGPGRCGSCGWHINKQGHAGTCSERTSA